MHHDIPLSNIKIKSKRKDQAEKSLGRISPQNEKNLDQFWKQLEDQRREQAAKEQKALEMEQIKLKKDV